MSWSKVLPDDVEEARACHARGEIDLKWTDGHWWSRERMRIGVEGSAPIRPTTDPMKTTIDDLRDNGPMVKTPDGRYVTQYQECACGEQFLVKSEHEGSSKRHKEYLRGGIEVEVPPQPIIGAFPRGSTPVLELGKVIICGRCQARDKKGMDYYPDRDSSPTNRFPCKRCLGHGVVPNVGPT